MIGVLSMTDSTRDKELLVSNGSRCAINQIDLAKHIQHIRRGATYLSSNQCELQFKLQTTTLVGNSIAKECCELTYLHFPLKRRSSSRSQLRLNQRSSIAMHIHLNRDPLGYTWCGHPLDRTRTAVCSQVAV